MLEWLTRDPLNGLVITFTFFISMTVGRYLRKKSLHLKHKGRIIDPRIKILVSFLLIIGITSMKHGYLPIAITALCIIFAAKLDVIRDYFKKLVFPLFISLFILALQSFTYGVNAIELGILSVYAEGIKYGFLIFSRVLASSSVLILLLLTTSENDFLESMRWFRVPKTMLAISSFMIRYIGTFSQEGRKLNMAQESRGFLKNSDFANTMHNTASICGLLITRAFARSEEVYRAMLSRAWKPENRYSLDILPLHKRDAVLGIISISGIISLVFLDWFL